METLHDHCIARIESTQVPCRYPREVGLNARLGVHGTGPVSSLCRVITDRGAEGRGLARIAPEDAAALIGRRLDELFDPAVGVTAPEALPLDLPLHDLAGVILGRPVYALMGHRGRVDVPCYDGAIYMDDLLPAEAPRGLAAVLENCAADYALGYRAFKLKIGRGQRWMSPEDGLRRDIEVTRAVREVYPECDILVDANDGYTCAGFFDYLDAAADCDLFWIEEPFPENRDDLRRLRECLTRRSPNTRIADGESRPDVPQLLELAREGLVDVLIMDIVGYGFTPWRAVMPEIVAAGALAAPHTWGDPLKTRYAGHLAAGLGHVLTLEGVPGCTERVDWSGYRLDAGRLSVPDLPGFGMGLVGASGA